MIKGEGVLVSSQTEVETYENPNNVPNTADVNRRNLNYSKQKTAMNYNVTKRSQTGNLCTWYS